MKCIVTCTMTALVILCLSLSTKAQTVDPFTGDMSYSLPLLTVPSPDGPGIPINLSYKAGIRNNQQASWVGLGWNLDVGSIKRGIRGVADDAQGQKVITMRDAAAGTDLSGVGQTEADNDDGIVFEPEEETYMFGPLQFKRFYDASATMGGTPYAETTLDVGTSDEIEYNANRTMDTYTSYLPSEQTSYSFPDYDSYLVTGPGMGGIMHPFLFSNGALVRESNKDGFYHTGKDDSGVYMINGDFHSTPNDLDDPVFLFMDEFASVTPPDQYFTGDVYTSGYTYFVYDQTIPDNFEIELSQVFTYIESYHFPGGNPFQDLIATGSIQDNSMQVTITSVPSGNIPTDFQHTAVPGGSYAGLNYTKGVKNKKQIQYYTENDIKNGTTPTSFIDCYEINKANRVFSGNVNQHQIGAYSVTDESGFTYHYSLPVYYGDETTRIFDTDNIESVEFYGNVINRVSVEKDGIIQQKKTGKYAGTWLLTAITGPDYVDKSLNNATPNNKVGAEDEGYWVSYRYGDLTNAFNTRTPLYGKTKFFNEAYIPDAHGYLEISGGFDANYKKRGSISEAEMEMYYLDYIETASHVAFFIKDIRLDDYSVDEKPKLKLDRIILLNASDKHLVTNYYSTSLGTGAFSIGSYAQNMAHVDVHAANMNAINAATLGSVVLNHDYSLSDKYHHNIRSNANTDSYSFRLQTQGGGYQNLASLLNFEEVKGTISCTDCGKLTLNSIKTYGFAGYDRDPSYKFAYAYNPEYSQYASDNWGYYKDGYSHSDDNTVFEQITNENSVHAWSLSEITTPSAGKIEIVYESDVYHKVGTFIEGELSGGKPTRTFPFASGTNMTNFHVNAYFTPDFKSFVTEQNGLLNIDKFSFIQPYHDCCCPNPGVINRIKGLYPASYWDDFTDNNTPDNLENYNYIDSELFPFSPPCGGDNLVPSSPSLAVIPNLCYPCGGTVTNGDGDPYLVYDPNSGDPYMNPIEREGGGISVHLKKAYGGGIRVKEIISKDNDSGTERKYTTVYNYFDSGVASNEPERFAPNYFNRLLKNLIIHDRSHFSPAVAYSKVGISSKGDDDISGPTNMVHHFYNYDEEECKPFYANHDISVDVFDYTQPETNPLYNVNIVYFKEYTQIKDNKSLYLGKIKRTETFDNIGNALSITENKYEESIGQLAESFAKKSYIENYQMIYNRQPLNPYSLPDYHDTPLEVSSFVTKTYPSPLVLSGQTVYKNGTKSSYSITDRDPLTGIPTEVVTTDLSTGEQVVSKKTLAYQLDSNEDGTPDYPDLGLVWDNTTNENLLTAVAKEEVYKDNKLVSAYKKTYRNSLPTRELVNNNGVYSYETTNKDLFWTEHETHVNNRAAPLSDGTIPMRKELENTLYNERGMVVEQKGLDLVTDTETINRFAATKYGYDNRYKLASISNARYKEFAYSGAEDPVDVASGNPYFGGEVNGYTNNNWYSGIAHTGDYSLKLNSGAEGFSYDVEIGGDGLDEDRIYKSSVWHKSDGNGVDIYAYYYDAAGTQVGYISSKPKKGKITLSGSTTISGTINSSLGPITTTQLGTIPTNPYYIEGYEWTQTGFEISPTAFNKNGVMATRIRVVVKARSRSTLLAYVDDFRFHPLDNPIVSYVYDADRGLVTAMLNEENFATFYEYDGMGRVSSIQREDLDGIRTLSRTEYNYKRGTE